MYMYQVVRFLKRRNDKAHVDYEVMNVPGGSIYIVRDLSLSAVSTVFVPKLESS